ncbi:MAG: transposase [Kiloniellales bacterium]|nr:transposase [Kiloniellales bacterium]
MTGSFDRIEVITGVARRRRWSVEEKRRIVAESLTSGFSVSAVAQRHGLRPNQLFQWRKLAREGAFGLSGDPVASFAPVHLVSGSAAGGWPQAASAQTGPAGVSGSPVEIILANGCRLRVAADIEASALHRLVATVKAAGG